MYGMKAFGWRPHREAHSKYYLPEAVYPLPYLPDYLTGPAYMFTVDLVKPLLRAHELWMNGTGRGRWFPLEDVYVTGLLTKEMGFENVVDRSDLFVNEFVPASRVCAIKNVISVHRMKAKDHEKLHQALKNAGEKCEKAAGGVNKTVG
jgi:hypothetical protein